LQSRKTGYFPGLEQLAFELERGLFGREKNQRRTGGIAGQRGPHFGETAERLAAAGRAEEKARLHAGIFTQRRKGAKEFIAGCFEADSADAVEAPIAWLRILRKFLTVRCSWSFHLALGLDKPLENFDLNFLTQFFDLSVVAKLGPEFAHPENRVVF